jgi:hypothetical protein
MHNLEKPGVETPFDFGTASIDIEHTRMKFQNWTNPASQIRNLRSQIGRPQVQVSPIPYFGFKVQDLSNFKILPKR